MYETIFPKLVLVNDAAHDVTLLEDQLPLATVLPSPVIRGHLDLAGESQGWQPIGEKADNRRYHLIRTRDEGCGHVQILELLHMC